MNLDKSAYKIHIVGGGISGLVAAKVLEEHGYHPTIVEASDRVGGRLKTDKVNGYQLDHGFQVLLTAYPAAQRHLDLEALQLQYFLSGAVLFKDGKKQTIGDPLRNPSLLLKTLFARVGSFGDKLNVLRLNQSLKRKGIDAIFAEEETSTLQYLKRFGFTDPMIDDFFRPFFSGIFLEPDLATSSRMFEFVYKMFGSGQAAIPKAGIEAIPHQLKTRLKQTSFRFNTRVHSVQDHKIILDTGEEIPTQLTIVATAPEQLIFNLKSQKLRWKSCETLYFETDSRAISQPLIGLLSNTETLINNIFYPTSLETECKSKKELLSVTVVKDCDMDDNRLQQQVVKELKTHCQIDLARFLKQYSIPYALPDLENIHYDIAPSETKIKDTIFLAGDHLLNGSLNAAMLSGERAAQGLVEVLEERPDLAHFTSDSL